MILNRITHRHLLSIIEENYDDLKDNILENEDFVSELDYSTFIFATFSDNGDEFIYIMDGKSVPVFTDMDEYNRMFADSDELRAKSADFDYISACGFSLIINPENHAIKIPEEFLEKRHDVFEKNQLTKYSYSPEELKIIANKIKNTQLQTLLESNSYTEEELFDALSKSHLLVRVYLDNPKSVDGIAVISDTPMIMGDDSILKLFTSKEKIKEKNIHVQVVDLVSFIEFALMDDFDGISIDGETVIYREMLLSNIPELKKKYNSSRYAFTYHLAFEL